METKIKEGKVKKGGIGIPPKTNPPPPPKGQGKCPNCGNPCICGILT